MLYRKLLSMGNMLQEDKKLALTAASVLPYFPITFDAHNSVKAIEPLTNEIVHVLEIKKVVKVKKEEQAIPYRLQWVWRREPLQASPGRQTPPFLSNTTAAHLFA